MAPLAVRVLNSGDVIAWMTRDQKTERTMTEAEITAGSGAPVPSVRYALRRLDEQGWASQDTEGRWTW